MTAIDNTAKLARVNAYRVAQGMTELKDFRPARHQEFLDTIVAPWEALMAEQAKADEAKSLAAVAASADFAGHTELQAKATEVAKAKTYKEVAHYGDSQVEKPVAFIHQFLSDNRGMSRKAAIVALTEGYGINFSTARTQYQRWFTANKKGE